jgi:hypothetical protein
MKIEPTDQCIEKDSIINLFYYDFDRNILKICYVRINNNSITARGSACMACINMQLMHYCTVAHTEQSALHTLFFLQFYFVCVCVYNVFV